MDPTSLPASERIFIGYPLSEDTRVALRERIASLGIPFLDSDTLARTARKWHFTLFFLGPVPAASIPEVVRVLVQPFETRKFSAEFGGFGAFPNPRAARVWWTGLGEGMAQLRHLHDELRPRLEGIGFSADTRPFIPHLTLRRFPRPYDVRGTLATAPSLGIRFPVDRIALFRSHGDHRDYEVIREVSL